ncbi:DUF4118 domain-containing protein [Sphingomonas colocasiae]|uniref:DUF4118 domain-containing protein n=1 Tax=Sphingomonas colocasiae TaxID=1848973 RepID=A0ABS7PUN3_9SPHN|nr:DUF4118 domain-containing protein [Sphingomonas colocasiae]MBY8825065.1 DUF4118 domain-containing protein [Sphingomonas colocasiae]
MTGSAPDVSQSAQHSDRVAALVDGGPGSDAVVRMAAALARAFGMPWEAIYVETPDGGREGPVGARAAEALSLATRTGGMVGTIAAATPADGIREYLGSAPAAHLVIGRDRPAARARWWRRPLAESLAADLPGIVLHMVPAVPAGDEAAVAPDPIASPAGAWREYLIAVALVLVTLGVAELLQFFTGTRSLDLVFLFPVIAVAARLGLRPAILAALLSVFSYNFFLLAPALSFDVAAPQNLVMSAVFLAAAAYTSIVTGRMRGRLTLSDRSARENAGLATLAQRLTRDADWEATALTLCEHVHGLFDVQAAVFREGDDGLVMTSAAPRGAALGPVDQAALDWSLAHGEEAGAGTGVMSAADWQFQPLKTSLGTLAILGLAREDGRDPVRPHQRVLLSTIVAQAALAHERLKLEDGMRAAARTGKRR